MQGKVKSARVIALLLRRTGSATEGKGADSYLLKYVRAKTRG